MSIKDFFAQRRAEYEAHIRPEIRALVERGSITKTEVAALRCNSWEWEAVTTAMTDEAFVEAVEHNLKNCSVRAARPYTSYTAALAGQLAPELVRRFRAHIGMPLPEDDRVELEP